MLQELAELIRQHPELRIREDSEFFEDKEGKLYIKSKQGMMLEVQFSEGGLVTQEVEKTKDVVKGLKRIPQIEEERAGFRSD